MIARAWLTLWLLLTAASVGAIAWQAIHRLTGGAWGDALSPSLRRLRNLFPLAAMAGLPLLIGAAHVFPWVQAPVEEARRWYLNYPFLAYRTLGCFVAWALAWRVSRRAPALTLIVWLFASGVFGNDWIVSLSPTWRSADVGLIVALGQLVVAFAAATVARAAETQAAVRRDLGGLLLALCLGWIYLVGIDYLTAWMADLPYENAWYLPRVSGPWAWLALAAILLHLLVPFVLLLGRRAKENAAVLQLAGASIVVGQACHVAWMVLP